MRQFHWHCIRAAYPLDIILCQKNHYAFIIMSYQCFMQWKKKFHFEMLEEDTFCKENIYICSKILQLNSCQLYRVKDEK